jgi:GTP-binding protein EngB required for normal cell division
MIDRFCATRKYKKRVFLITDGEHPTQTNKDETKSLIEKLNEKGIRLNVITLDFANELGK